MLERLQMKRIEKQEGLAFLLLFNAFSWYYLSLQIISKVGYAFGAGSSEILILEVSYPLSVIISAIVSSIVLSKVPKNRVLSGWIITGIIASFCAAIPFGPSLPGTLTATIVLGASLGAGMPTSLEYFRSSTPVGSRGKIGGMTLFGTLLCVPLIYTIMSESNLVTAALILAIWRAWCMPLALSVSKKEEHSEATVKKSVSLGSILRMRVFILYFVAWLMFSLVDFGSIIGAASVEGFGFLVKIIEPACAGISAVLGGVAADRVGRKKVLIFGFVSLGVAYAAVGVSQNPPPLAWIFYFVTDGVALGLLWVLFMLVLWGEIGSGASEKVYALGETPFFLTEILSVILVPYLTGMSQSNSSIFSLVAFFLFIAVLPLLFAPETLPEKNIKDRELKIYVENAKKIKQKYP